MNSHDINIEVISLRIEALQRYLKYDARILLSNNLTRTVVASQNGRTQQQQPEAKVIKIRF